MTLIKSRKPFKSICFILRIRIFQNRSIFFIFFEKLFPINDDTNSRYLSTYIYELIRIPGL